MSSGFHDNFTPHKMEKIALAALDNAGGVLSWQNNTGNDIIITRLVLDIITPSTAAGTLSGGTTATSGATSSANLIDTLDVNAAAGAFSNTTSPGTNGKTQQRLAAGKWLTISKASGAMAGLVGNAYISFFPL